jgi:hypothetical protein
MRYDSDHERILVKNFTPGLKCQARDTAVSLKNPKRRSGMFWNVLEGLMVRGLFSKVEHRKKLEHSLLHNLVQNSFTTFFLKCVFTIFF